MTEDMFLLLALLGLPAIGYLACLVWPLDQIRAALALEPESNLRRHLCQIIGQDLKDGPLIEEIGRQLQVLHMTDAALWSVAISWGTTVDRFQGPEGHRRLLDWMRKQALDRKKAVHGLCLRVDQVLANAGSLPTGPLADLMYSLAAELKAVQELDKPTPNWKRHKLGSSAEDTCPACTDPGLCADANRCRRASSEPTP